MSKHTQRTLKHYRDDGYICDVIERWIPIPSIPGGGKRKDWFGFADILGFRGSDVILIQSCGADYSKHKTIILDNEVASKWAEWHKLELICWRKVLKKRGGKQKIYKPRIGKFHLIHNQLECLEIKGG